MGTITHNEVVADFKRHTLALVKACNPVSLDHVARELNVQSTAIDPASGRTVKALTWGDRHCLSCAVNELVRSGEIEIVLDPDHTLLDLA